MRRLQQIIKRLIIGITGAMILLIFSSWVLAAISIKGVVAYESIKYCTLLMIILSTFAGIAIIHSGEAEIKLKYDGYIKRQMSQAAQARKMESRLIPDDIDYTNIHGLRLEARQKLEKIRPKSIGQASRISGVSPADISVLIIWLEAHTNRNR